MDQDNMASNQDDSYSSDSSSNTSEQSHGDNSDCDSTVGTSPGNDEALTTAECGNSTVGTSPRKDEASATKNKSLQDNIQKKSETATIRISERIKNQNLAKIAETLARRKMEVKSSKTYNGDSKKDNREEDEHTKPDGSKMGATRKKTVLNNKNEVENVEAKGSSMKANEGMQKPDVLDKLTHDIPPILSKNLVDDEIKAVNQNQLLIQFLAVIIILVAIIMAYSTWYPTTSVFPSQPSISPAEILANKLKVLEEGSVQDPKLWRIIRSTLKRHIVNDNPNEPAVIMLVSTKKASKTMECLATKIATAYSARCGNSPFHFDGNLCKDLSAENAKMKIDKEITKAFEDGKACAVVVSQFQALPAASTTVFYQFCENDSAPFKDVAIIMTLEVEHDGSWDTDGRYSMIAEHKVPSPKLWDTIVDDYLHHSLGTRDNTGKMTTDMISGLLTRVTPAVAWVTEEKDHIC